VRGSHHLAADPPEHLHALRRRSRRRGAGLFVGRLDYTAGAGQFDALSKEWAQADARLDIVQRLHDDTAKLGR